jgi:NAD(P)H-dependent FMN reductase
MAENMEIRVAAICGSLRNESITRMALRLALSGASELGATTQLIDLRDYELAFCDGSGDYPQDVTRLRTDVATAHGILIGTPVYHGSFSGVLKNALDLMGFREFEGSVVGLLGVAGGSTGAMVPLVNLRTVGRVLHAWVVPDEVSIANADTKFSVTGECTDEALSERLINLGRKVARFSYLHHSHHTQEFVETWETSAENPGIPSPDA